MVAQGDVWWAELAEPQGSEPGFRRPVLVVQSDAFNQSRIRTVVCIPLTSNQRWAAAPGNVRLTSRATGLDRDSVALVAQITTLDRRTLTDYAGKISRRRLNLVLSGVDIVLGR